MLGIPPESELPDDATIRAEHFEAMVDGAERWIRCQWRPSTEDLRSMTPREQEALATAGDRHERWVAYHVGLAASGEGDVVLAPMDGGAAAIRNALEDMADELAGKTEP